MPLLDGPSLGGNARHVLRQYAEENALARGRGANAAGTEEFGGGCLRGRYNNLREVIQNNPSLVVVPSIINAGSLFVQRPICRTNYLPNNSMAGATGSVLPTTWSSGSIPAGITISYSASGTAVAADGTSVNYIDVTVSGTAGASGFLNIRPNPSPSTIAAFVGQSWNTSVYLQLISGSVASISPTWQLQELNSSQTFLQGSNIGGLGSLAVGGQFDRYNVSRVLTDSATAFVTCRWGHSFVSGTTYSYTLRIGSPQLERFSVPTPMIATSTGAVTRLNESTNVVGLPPDFTVSRNTTATRVNSSGLIESVASGVPRIDWLGQSCPALLVEPAATNLVPNGTAFNTVTDLSFTNSSDSPASSISGTLITKITGVTGGVFAQQTCLTSLPSGSTTYTISRFFKYNGTNLTTSLSSNVSTQWGGTSWIQQVVISAASGVTLGTSTNCTGSVENYGNGWYRVSARLTTGASPSGSTTVQYLMIVAGSVASGSSFLTALPQLEVGSIATTYIPTTTAAVSRAADVISASGALVSGLIGQTEGTIYAEVAYSSILFTKTIISITDGTVNNRIAIRINSTTFISARIVVAGASNDYNVTIPAIPSSGILKISLAYKADDYVFAINGTTYASTTTRPVPATNAVTLGNNGFNGDYLNDRIRADALYTTRLSNAQLAELTRL